MLKERIQNFRGAAAPILRKYGMAIGLFLFGIHLHAQVEYWSPLWDKGRISPYDESLLYKRVYNPEGQIVTARWLMLSGICIWMVSRYGLFERWSSGDKD